MIFSRAKSSLSPESLELLLPVGSNSGVGGRRSLLRAKEYVGGENGGRLTTIASGSAGPARGSLASNPGVFGRAWGMDTGLRGGDGGKGGNAGRTALEDRRDLPKPVGTADAGAASF